MGTRPSVRAISHSVSLRASTSNYSLPSFVSHFSFDGMVACTDVDRKLDPR